MEKVIMQRKNKKTKIKQLLFWLGYSSFVAVLPMNTWSAFYQSETLAQYCKEYIKLINLENPVNQLEAGICSGYFASKIEVMDLSEQLCQRDKVNLDSVVVDFVRYIEENKDAKEHSATYVVVDLLQQKYACNAGS